MIGLSSLRHTNDPLGEQFRAERGKRGHFHKKSRRSPESWVAGLVHGPRLTAVNPSVAKHVSK